MSKQIAFGKPIAQVKQNPEGYYFPEKLPQLPHPANCPRKYILGAFPELPPKQYPTPDNIGGEDDQLERWDRMWGHR